MLAAGAVLAGCNKASENVPQEETKMIAKSFAVSMNETKTTLGDGLAVNWSKGDQIKVIAVLSDSEQESYVFDLQSGEGKASAVFSGEIAEKYAEAEIYALYPATYDAEVSGTTLSVTGYASHNVEAVEGDFDASRALLFAKAAENEITFNHGVAYFKIQIGYEDVKSVKFTCDGNERIYGNPVYSFADLTKSSTINNGSSSDNYVILAKEGGASLVKDAVYYVPVTAKASSFGKLQLTYTYADGTSATKTAAMTDASSKALYLNFGKVYDLGNPPVVPEVLGEETAKYTWDFSKWGKTKSSCDKAYYYYDSSSSDYVESETCDTYGNLYITKDMKIESSSSWYYANLSGGGNNGTTYSIIIPTQKKSGTLTVWATTNKKSTETGSCVINVKYGSSNLPTVTLDVAKGDYYDTSVDLCNAKPSVFTLDGNEENVTIYKSGSNGCRIYKVELTENE